MAAIVEANADELRWLGDRSEEVDLGKIDSRLNVIPKALPDPHRP